MDELPEPKLNDHDLIITLHAEVKGVRKDIREIKDGLSSKVATLESKVQALEIKVSGFNTAMVIYTAGVIVMIGLNLYHIYQPNL